MGYNASTVDKWKQSGTLFFWRFKENERNYPGWHFMLDSFASESMAALLRAMRVSAESCERTIVVTRPTEVVLRVPNNRGGAAAWSAPAKLRLEYSVDNPAAWSLGAENSVVRWQLGAEHISIVAEAFADPIKFFDSSIGSDPVVWSWGLLERLVPNSSLERTRDR